MRVLSAVLLGLLLPYASANCMSGNFDANNNYFTETTVVDNSDEFTIEYKNFYKEVTTGGRKYLLLQCFENEEQQTAARNELPACTANDATPCSVINIPVKSVSIAGDNDALHFLEELDVLDTVKSTSKPFSSPCLLSKDNIGTTDVNDATQMAGIDVVFASRFVHNGDQSKIVSVDKIHEETSPQRRAEWIEFMSTFFNKEGIANYIVYRSEQIYSLQQNKARTLPRKKIAWITSIVGGMVNFTNSQAVASLAEHMNAELVNFGSNGVIVSDPNEVESYRAQMKEVDLIVLDLSRKVASEAEAVNLLGLNGVADVKVVRNGLPDMIVTFDRYNSADFLNEHIESVALSAPDLLMADLLKYLHLTVSPWTSTEWVFSRFVSESPLIVSGNQYACTHGLRRPSSIVNTRNTIMSSINQAAANPTAPITNFDANTDYFPAKVNPQLAHLFEIHYHLFWKLVRNRNTNEEAMLILKGVPQSAYPPATVLPQARRFMIPVTSIGLQATPSVHMEMLLGNFDLIKTSTYSPHPCIMAVHEESEVENPTIPVFNKSRQDVDVLFTNGKEEETNTISAKVTSDVGPVHRAEWILFHAAFHNKEEAATSIFESIRNRYFCIAERGAQARATSGLTPRVILLSSWAGTYTANQAAYNLQLLRDAGGLSVTDPELRGPNSPGSPGAFGGIVFTPDELRDVLRETAVFVDQSYFADGVRELVNYTRFNTNYNFTEQERQELPPLRDQRVFRIDNGVEAKKSFSDQFTRYVAEPDAVLEDLIDIIHPGWDSSRINEPKHFYRNVFNETITRLYRAEDCVREPIRPLASDFRCSVPCVSRTLELYCQIGCVWNSADSTCSDPPVTPVQPTEPEETAEPEAGALSTPLLTVLFACLIIVMML